MNPSEKNTSEAIARSVDWAFKRMIPQMMIPACRDYGMQRATIYVEHNEDEGDTEVTVSGLVTFDRETGRWDVTRLETSIALCEHEIAQAEAELLDKARCEGPAVNDAGCDDGKEK